MHFCPHCGKSKLKLREVKRPPYRCASCKEVCDAPRVKKEPVDTYRAFYKPTWVDLSGEIGAGECRELCLQRKSQHSIRPLNWSRFQDRIGQFAAGQAWLRIANPKTEGRPGGGHRQATVRVRRGQQKFRKDLLEKYGDTCAFNGSTPRDALDAAHLYSYADKGRHEIDGGGLLLRKDVHRLFDLGLIAINPTTLTIDVREDLLPYPVYADLNSKKMSVEPSRKMEEWLSEHWTTHRNS
jgi:hypothetical protein